MFELRTLGGLELLHTGDGDSSAIPMQAKRLALLAHLAALPPHSFRRRDTLLLLFWPDLDQEHARGALRQALYFLRKTLGEGAILTRGEDEIGLEPTAVCSDARRLEAAVAGGKPEVALTLYRGDFLEGVFVSDAAPELEDWIAGERQRLRHHAAKAAWMASELPANRDSVGDLVRRAVHWSGDDEGALRRGLKILDGMGDRAGAAALYDEFARRVARDFDVELSTETRNVIKALRARRASGQHDVPSAAPRPTPVATAREPIPVAAPAERPGKRLRLAGTAGALLVLALAVYIGPGHAKSRGASNLPTVMPFRVSEADSALTWLGDGIVELLTVRLGGAGGMGASYRVEGRVTGTKQHLILSATLSSATGSLPVSRATVEGSADSMPQLVDGLAAQLLGMNAGIEEDRLPLLTGVSLPAVRLYIAGLAASHRANLEAAFRLYSEALDLDPTFTLAGLQACRLEIWASTGELRERGCQIARRGKDRLSPPDRALLDANPSAWASSVEMLAGLNAALVAYPDRPENWYALGYAHFRMGLLMGEEQWVERAIEAFRQGWLLDSAAASVTGTPRIAEPILHWVELAQLRHDTAEVVRLTGSLFAVDTTSDVARILMWHRALVTGDSAREAFWHGIGSASQKVTMFILLFMDWTGLGMIDRDRVLAANNVRLRSHDPGFASFAFTIVALNGGRPDAIPLEGPSHGLAANTVHRARIRRALAWDGDTALAVESVRLLSQSIATPASGEAARQQLLDLCAVGEWQAARGDYAGAAKSISRLRHARVDSTLAQPGQTARYASLCLTLLDAMRASGLRLPDARAKVAAADSLAREYVFVICCGERFSEVNIQIARLWEREGDTRAALRAIERRADPFRWAPVYMSTFLREEGRLAVLTGDTARAVDAYRRYLAFRSNPQASLKPGVDSIRAQLALLQRRQSVAAVSGAYRQSPQAHSGPGAGYEDLKGGN
jgi:DNA-binding SARP family transcriptional activator